MRYAVTRRAKPLFVMSVAVIFVALGLAMILFGWNLYSEQQKLRAWGVETEGQIVGFQRLKVEHENRLDINFVPVVMFKTESGEDVTFMGGVAEWFWTDYQMGESLTVIYKRESPWDARIDELVKIRFLPVILIWVGLGVALISLSVIIFGVVMGRRNRHGDYEVGPCK